jgi:hypothetical protein
LVSHPDHRADAARSPGGRLHHRLERIHRALGLAHLTQPDQALKSMITISTMDVLHCLITSKMTAAPTGMSRM